MATQSNVAKTGEKILGGFTKAPFSSPEGGWNISWETDVYQCGKKVSSSQQLGSLHQVWFRGQAPTKDFLFARIAAKNE